MESSRISRAIFSSQAMKFCMRVPYSIPKIATAASFGWVCFACSQFSRVRSDLKIRRPAITANKIKNINNPILPTSDMPPGTPREKTKQERNMKLFRNVNKKYMYIRIGTLVCLLMNYHWTTTNWLYDATTVWLNVKLLRRLWRGKNVCILYACTRTTGVLGSSYYRVTWQGLCETHYGSTDHPCMFIVVPSMSSHVATRQLPLSELGFTRFVRRWEYDIFGIPCVFHVWCTSHTAEGCQMTPENAIVPGQGITTTPKKECPVDGQNPLRRSNFRASPSRRLNFPRKCTDNDGQYISVKGKAMRACTFSQMHEASIWTELIRLSPRDRRNDVTFSNNARWAVIAPRAKLKFRQCRSPSQVITITVINSWISHHYIVYITQGAGDLGCHRDAVEPVIYSPDRAINSSPIAADYFLFKFPRPSNSTRLNRKREPKRVTITVRDEPRLETKK